MTEQYPQNSEKQAPNKCRECFGSRCYEIGKHESGAPILWCADCGSWVWRGRSGYVRNRPGLLVDVDNGIRFADSAWRASWLRTALRDCAELLSPSQLSQLFERWEPSWRWVQAVLIWGSDRPIPLVDGKPAIETETPPDEAQPGITGPYRKRKP